MKNVEKKFSQQQQNKKKRGSRVPGSAGLMAIPKKG